MNVAWNLIFPWFSTPNNIAYWRQRLNQPRLWLNICDFSATKRQHFSVIFFYQQVAVIFTCSRLLQDATYSYLPLYLTKTQGFEKVRKTNIFSAFPSLLFIITFSLIYFLACRKESHYITLNTKDACGQRNKCSVANLNKPNGLGLLSLFLQLTSLPPISQASAKNNKPTLAGCEKLGRGSEPIGNREIFLNE